MSTHRNDHRNLRRIVSADLTYLGEIVDEPDLILSLLPDLSVSHDSIPQELRAVSAGAQEAQIW